MVAPYSTLRSLQSELSLNTGVCLVLIPTVPVYDFSTANQQLRLCSCECASVERKIWRTGTGRGVFILGCLLKLFPLFPSSVSCGGLNTDLFSAVFCTHRKSEQTMKEEYTMAYYCCPLSVPLVSSFVVLLAVETLFCLIAYCLGSYKFICLKLVYH